MIGNSTQRPDEYSRRLLARSSVKATIATPVGLIDVTNQLFNVDEREYIACTPF